MCLGLFTIQLEMHRSLFDPERGRKRCKFYLNSVLLNTMKQVRYFALALLFGAMFSLTAFAQKGPNPGGGPGTGAAGGPNHFGLSDSCWNVFLSGLSSSDAAKLTADQQTIADNQKKIDDLQKQINELMRNGGKDTAVRSKVKALENQIRTLNDANNAAQLEIGTIIKTNGASLELVMENCGRPVKGDGGRDTGKGGGSRDTSKHGDKGINTRGHFGLSDSCWNIFLTQISTSDAAQLAADQKTIADNQAQADAISQKIKALRANGKDSATRAAIKDLNDQLRALKKSSDEAMKDFASIIRKNNDILQSIRKDCGRGHKGTIGDPGNGLTVSDIVPNPATVGGTASVTITLTSDGEVNIFGSNAAAQGPPAIQLFHGTMTAGSHTQEFPLRGLGTGVYLITVQSGNSSVSKKLMIQ
jgi:hypothetical protein